MSAPCEETEALEAHLASIPPRAPPEPGTRSGSPWLHWRDPFPLALWAHLRRSDGRTAARAVARRWLVYSLPSGSPVSQTQSFLCPRAPGSVLDAKKGFLSGCQRPLDRP